MCPRWHPFTRTWHGSTIGGLFLLWSFGANALITSELSLDARGVWYRDSYGRSNFGLLLELNVPLDPKRPSSVHGSLLQDERDTPVDEVPLDPLERDSAETGSDTAPDSTWGDAVGREGSLAEPMVFDSKFVADLTTAALVAQGCDAAWSRLETLGSRNRASALLPEVTLRAGREQDTALRLTPTDADPYRYTQSDASNVLLEGRLAWRLGRLLFSSEDLGLERLKLARSRERQRVVERTLAVLFQWMRAQSELVTRRRSPRRASRVARWEALQAAMRLDAMTAGWFTAHLPATSGPPSPSRQQDTSAATPTDAAAPNPPRPTAPVPQQPEKEKSAGSGRAH